jgi:hypothetical protein
MCIHGSFGPVSCPASLLSCVRSPLHPEDTVRNLIHARILAIRRRIVVAAGKCIGVMINSSDYFLRLCFKKPIGLYRLTVPVIKKGLERSPARFFLSRGFPYVPANPFYQCSDICLERKTRNRPAWQAAAVSRHVYNPTGRGGVNTFHNRYTQ